MAQSIPIITKIVPPGDLQYILNWLIGAINTQNVSGTTPAPFPG